MIAGVWESAAVAAAVTLAAVLLLWVDRARPRLGWLILGMSALAAAGVLLERLVLRPAIDDALRGAAGAGAADHSTAAGAAVFVGVLIRVGILLVAVRLGQVGCPADGAILGAQVGAVAGCLGALLALRGIAAPAPGYGVLATLAIASSTSLLGSLLGAARLTARRGAQAVAVVGGIIAASAFDAGFSGPFAALAASYRGWGEAAAELTALLVLVGIVNAAFWYERKLLLEELGEEVGTRVLPSWVAATIPYYLRRARGGWWERSDERRAVSALLVTLGFRKRRLRTLDEEQARVYSLEVGRLRQRARVLLVQEVAEPVEHEPGPAR